MYVYLILKNVQMIIVIEVEVKAKIENFDEMEEKILKLGGEQSKTEFQEDLYFNSPIVDFVETDEALRIRTTNENIFITYKGPKINKEAKTRKEVEIAIENAEKGTDILESVGFKQVRTVRKNRKYFEYENFEISLDDVEGLDPYMEIEIALPDGTDYREAQKSIFELYKKLGITDGFETTSYLELLEK